MKVTTTTKEQKFKPFTLQLHVETLEEAGKLFALFNHSTISGALDSEEAIFPAVKECIRSGCEGQLVYEPWHHKLCEALYSAW